IVARGVPLLTHAADEEDLVVHREAEEHREEEHRDPALDLVELRQAERLSGAELEGRHEDPVGSGDREQVEDDRLEREEQRAERPDEQDGGEEQPGEDEPGDRAVGDVEEVDTEGWAATCQHIDAGGEGGGWNDHVPEAAYKLL